MKIEDAAKLLNLDGQITPEIVKKAYRRASSKYHPDKGGSVPMMQTINAAYELLQDHTGDITAGQSNYPDELNTAINAIIDIPGIVIEVCGAWVWVTGNTKPHAKRFGRNGAGFYYAKKKTAWYFRPNDWKSHSKGYFSLDEIRAKHGSEYVERKARKTIAA